MSRQQALLLVIVSALLGPGCSLHERGVTFDPDLVHYKHLADSTEFPDVGQMTAEIPPAAPPRTIRDTSGPDSWWDMSLSEAIQIALDRSPVMRDLGGAYVRSPATVRTVHQPSIEASDPRIGMEAALSAFDATLQSSLTYEHNRRWMNNFLSSGGAPLEGLKQDYVQYQTQLAKQAATGTQMTVRGIVVYDSNNQAANKFPNTYDTIAEAEIRQPVLQGAGLDFNRTAGPSATLSGNSGVLYNGITVARLNTDISLIDFRIGIRDVVSNVENTYWDLYFSYRDLHAKIEARNRCLETWRAINNMMLAGQDGGKAEREAQFRGQYYRFEEEVKNALTGQLLDRTATFNGSSGGTFRGVAGVQVAERRLRLVLGLDISDGRQIRPADEPTLARVEFDWQQLVVDSVTRREELHRQRLNVRRRELEASASRNFLLPRFDVFTRFRARGVGQNWVNGASTKINAGEPEFLKDSSLENLFGGTFQEYMVGGEFFYPVGFRRAHSAVRNAQLQLAREHAVLQEQERQIIHDLSNAYADVQRAYEIVQTNYNGRLAAKTQVDILRGKIKGGNEPINWDQVIDAERRFGETESLYYRTLAEYMIALKNVQFEKGTLLEYSRVELAESQDTAVSSLLGACRTDMRTRAELLLDYTLSRPLPVRSGLDQEQPESAQGAASEPADSASPPALPAALPTLPDPVPNPLPEPVPAPRGDQSPDDQSGTTRPQKAPSDTGGQASPTESPIATAAFPFLSDSLGGIGRASPSPPVIRTPQADLVAPSRQDSTTAPFGAQSPKALSPTVRPQEVPSDRNVQTGQGGPPLATSAFATLVNGAAGESTPVAAAAAATPQGETSAARPPVARKAGWRLSDAPWKTAERWLQGAESRDAQ
ncbi:MAG: TolC family protein [Planctomycetota bacterium]|nr:TolC family protein [Planctomycetota bacterium]